MKANIDRTPIDVEEKRIPEEVLRLESLLLDNGWKMLIERLKSTIISSERTLKQSMPLWLNKEEKETYVDDMERIKLKINAYEELIALPEEMIREYSNTDFRTNYSNGL